MLFIFGSIQQRLLVLDEKNGVILFRLDLGLSFSGERHVFQSDSEEATVEYSDYSQQKNQGPKLTVPVDPDALSLVNQ